MQDSLSAIHEPAAAPAYVPLPWRDHTILGVCEAIGEDFGFNPTWLRVVLASGVLVSPTYAIGTYLGLGALVLLSRLLFPKAMPVSVSTPHLVVAQADAALPAPTPLQVAEKVPLAA